MNFASQQAARFEMIGKEHLHDPLSWWLLRVYGIGLASPVPRLIVAMTPVVGRTVMAARARVCGCCRSCFVSCSGIVCHAAAAELRELPEGWELDGVTPFWADGHGLWTWKVIL